MVDNIIDSIDADKCRRISTHMYGDKAFDVLETFCAVGLGEYGGLVGIDRSDDNRICVKVKNGSYSSLDFDFNKKTDAQILSWLAGRLKRYVSIDASFYGWTKGKWWNSRNAEAAETMCVNWYRPSNDLVSIADFYKICQCLKGKWNTPDSKIVSKPLTLAEIESKAAVDNAKRKAIAAFYAESSELRQKLDRRLTTEIGKAREKCIAECLKIDPNFKEAEIYKYRECLANDSTNV